MLRRNHAKMSAFFVFFVALAALGQELIGTGFTYQGQLALDEVLVNETADFEFTLWDAESDGTMIGSSVTADQASLVDGLFSVGLDFGPTAFNGEARWLEISVASPSDGSFTTLSPRQPLTATPYALQTRGLLVEVSGNVGIGTNDALGRLHVSKDLDPSIQFENVGNTTADRNVSLNFAMATELARKLTLYERLATTMAWSFRSALSLSAAASPSE